jgi:tetratricopeptide (TPR) repeat protein
MCLYHLACRVAVSVSLLTGAPAFSADVVAIDDIQKCKTSDRYHNSVEAFYACDTALKQMNLSKEDRAELLLGRGEAAYFAGRFDLSSVDLDEALALNPNLNEAYLRRAWTRMRTNQYPGALQDITTLLSQDPDNVDALFAIGFLYKESPEWERKTMPAFKRALELNPNHFLTRLNLASIYANYKHDYGAAIAEYDRILSASEEDLNKVRLWREPGFHTFDFRGQVRMDRAEAIYNLEDYPKALADLDKLVLDYPQIDEVFLVRGRVYDRLRKFGDALADAQTAVKLDPRWPAQRLLEIKSLFHLKRHDEALLSATRLIDETNIDFARGEALFWRGYINKALHHSEDSLRDFEQSFVLHPQWQWAIVTQLRYSGYYEGEVSDYYSEKVRNGLQACILDPECAAR